MRHQPPAQTADTSAPAWLPWAFLLYLAFVVYGSLLPFELRPPPTAGAWEAFLHLPYLELGVASRADWVANLLLYIPLGFLTVGWAQGRAPANPIHGLAALIVVGAIAVGVEYAQVFFAPRTVSMNDLIAEGLGAAIGVALWYATRDRFARLLAESLGSGTRALRAAIVLYLVGYVVLAIFPFDFLVSVDELRWRLSGDGWGLLFAGSEVGGPMRRVLQLLVDFAAMVPLGVLIALDGSLSRDAATKRAAIAGASAGLLIEWLQFLTASGISQGASVAARSAGAVLGVWLAARSAGWARRPVPSWVATAMLVALPLYALALASLNGWFGAPWLPLDQALARLKPAAFLPFYFHYFTTELEAMQSLVANALMYAPVGVGYWLWAAARRSRPLIAVPAALAAAIAAVIEIGKFFAPAKHADPTNVLIAAASAALALLIARRVVRALVMAAAVEPHPVSSREIVIEAADAGAVGGDEKGRIDVGSTIAAAPRADARPFGEARLPGSGGASLEGRSTISAAPSGASARPFGKDNLLDSGATSRVSALTALWPRETADRFRFVGGVLLLALAAAILLRFPLWQPALAVALVAYGWGLWRKPSLWLVVIPALLPSLDLATRSGWYFVDELDLFLLVTVGVALLRPATGEAPAPLPRRAVVLLALFAASYAIATLRGVLPLGPLDLNALSNPYGPLESLRAAKGVIWAFALLPLLRRAFVTPTRAGRRLVAGVTLGLLLAGVAVFWERLVFTGLFDFATDFRATGAFSGMNTGGSEIEAYLVMALPFALLALTQRGRWYGAVLGLAAFTLGGYALLVTFARGGYAAGAVGLAVAAVGLLVARRAGGRGARSWGRAMGAGVTSAVVVLLAVVVVSGPYMTGRFAGTGSDLQTRWKHWADAIGMMDEGFATSLLGMGVGRFPESYFWKTEKNDRPGTFAFVEEGGHRFLRLGAGDALYVRQKVSVEPHTQYRLSLDARSAVPGTRFTVFLCEQTLLYSARCKSKAFTTAQEGGWHSLDATIDTGGVGSAGWQTSKPLVDTDSIGRGGWLSRPVYLGLNYTAGESAVDIDSVRLVAPSGENLLRNGDFERGFDHWFFAVDGHLAWHVKNLWAAIYFEQGLLGVLAFGLLVGYAVVVLASAVRRGSRVSAVILAAVSALIVIGLLESPLDFPRIALLFYLLLFAGIVRSGAGAR